MKIGLLGYGKMGQEIEKIALGKGHEIVWKINKENRASLLPDLLREADVVIEFTSPHAAPENLKYCIEHKIPVVTGSTGWYTQLPEIRQQAEAKGAALFYASNFSIGVNVFFAVSRYMAKLLNDYPEYRAHIEEIHHTQKLDAPSGTAITLAEKTYSARQDYTGWKLEGTENANEIPIRAIRTENVPGTHTLTWSGPADKLVFTHEAFNRSGFAAGAVQAAEWLLGRTGVFTMDDLLKLNNE